MERGERWILFVVLIVAVLSGLAVWYTWREDTSSAATLAAQSDAPVKIVIDAGHGGEDGGAVSLSGMPESQINLSIACKLEDILAFYGQRCQMLRREDISLHDASAETIREKKVSDLHNRVRLVESAAPELLVSIHQNSYPDSKYHGAQVFYAATKDSDAIAQQVQRVLADGLDPSNTREAKQIPDTVYLMNHITCPAILVECGFLTNPQEEAMLRQETYQRKLAAALSSAILTTLD